MAQLRKSKRLKQTTTDMENKEIDNQIKEHPLCNELVLENILGYLKGENSAKTLTCFRSVCKVWNREIVKLLRKDTQINLTKILGHYPAGLGWTATPENLETPYYYKAPYPEIPSFTNILVRTNSCKMVKNQKWISWFQIMGSEVKGLCFSSPLTCFCHNQFLEQILKEWCPNLVSLELCNVKCIESLLLVSSFYHRSTPLICKDLKTLTISVTGDKSHILCPEMGSTVRSMLPIQVAQFCMQYLSGNMMRVIYKHGLISRQPEAFPEIVNFSDGKVVLPLQRFEDEDEDIPDMSKDLSTVLECTDGGIIAKLMKEINLETLKIGSIGKHKTDFATFFHLRPNKWRSTLKELEFDETLSKSLSELNVIAQVKFPLTRIKLSRIHHYDDNEHMTRFLSYFADTLEILEIGGRSVQQDVKYSESEIDLPLLPKLRTFVHENISACVISGGNLWKNAPNLKTCILERDFTQVWDYEDFFENFGGILNNSMTELRLLEPITLKQAECLLDSFPSLVKLELVLESIGQKSADFFENLEHSKVVDLKITFLDYLNRDGIRLIKWRSACFWKLGNIGGLKFLELNNEAKLPLHIVPKPFSKGKLTSLKLINFRMFIEDKDKTMRSLSHIPSVELVDTVYIKKSVPKSKKKK